MKNVNGKTIAELAVAVGGHVIGEGEVMIYDVAQLESAAAGTIAFLEDEKFINEAQSTNASCLSLIHI